MKSKNMNTDHGCHRLFANTWDRHQLQDCKDRSRQDQNEKAEILVAILQDYTGGWHPLSIVLQTNSHGDTGKYTQILEPMQQK